jgi:hypothetical protein
VQDVDFTEGDSFSDEGQVDLNMFGSLMLDWVGGEINSTDIIAINHCSKRSGQRSSIRSWRNQQASATPFVTARYSASALDRDTVG